MKISLDEAINMMDAICRSMVITANSLGVDLEDLPFMELQSILEANTRKCFMEICDILDITTVTEDA